MKKILIVLIIIFSDLKKEILQSSIPFTRYLDYAIFARGIKALFSEFVFISILLY